MGFSRRPLGSPRLQRCVLLVCDSPARECHSTRRRIAVKQPREVPGSVCAQQPRFGISAVLTMAEPVPHRTVQEPLLSPALGASLCVAPKPHGSPILMLQGQWVQDLFLFFRDMETSVSCCSAPSPVTPAPLLTPTGEAAPFHLPFLQKSIFKNSVLS